MRPKRKATLQRPDYHALHNNISTPTAKWLALIRDPGKSGRKIREGESTSKSPRRVQTKLTSSNLPAHYPRVDGSIVRKSWLDGTYDPEQPVEIAPETFFGPDREPIIIPSSRGGFESLGGKVPSKENFGIDEVVKLVGKDYMVDVMGMLSVDSEKQSLTGLSIPDVASQSSTKWSLAQWAYYYKTGIPPTTDTKNKSSNSKRAEPDTTAAMQKVYNVISLECTGTELAKLVRPPRLVKEVDWVDNCWPDSRKKRKHGHVNFDPRTTKGDVVNDPAQTTPSISKAPPAEPQVPERNLDDPMQGPPVTAEQQKQPVESQEPIDDDSVAGKRKLDGDGWPKVKLYCLMGKAGSWTVSEQTD